METLGKSCGYVTEEAALQRGAVPRTPRSPCHHSASEPSAIHACHPRTQKAEAGGLRVPGQPEPHNEFKANLGYIMSSRPA